MINKFLIILFIIQSFSAFSQNDFAIIETNRISNINSTKTTIINNPTSSININVYHPDKEVIKLFNLIISKFDKLENGQKFIQEKLKRIKKTDPFNQMKNNVSVRYEYIQKNMNIISLDTSMLKKTIPINNIQNSLNSLKEYSENYNTKKGFDIKILEQNSNFVFKSDFSNGYSKVCLNNRCSYIDRKGELVNDFIYGLKSRNFNEGFAYIETLFEGNYIINTKFERIINVTDFDIIDDYKYGTATYTKGNTKGIITSKGKVIDYKKLFHLDSIQVNTIFKTKIIVFLFK